MFGEPEDSEGELGYSTEWDTSSDEEGQEDDDDNKVGVTVLPE